MLLFLAMALAVSTCEAAGSVRGGATDNGARVSHLPTAPRPRVLGHTKIESTMRYLGIEADDALTIAEQVDV